MTLMSDLAHLISLSSFDNLNLYNFKSEAVGKDLYPQVKGYLRLFTKGN